MRVGRDAIRVLRETHDANDLRKLKAILETRSKRLICSTMRIRMLHMTGSVCIDAPVENVWAVLSDLEAIHVWVPAIRRAYCPARRRGVGAVRVCELGQGTLRETVLEWNEGRSFKYRGDGAPMLETATNLWTVEAHGERQTLVTTTSEAVIKGGLFGRVLEPLMKVMFERMGARSLASLKYLVEHGEPYTSAGALTLGPTTC